jgi:hypothetical protein
METCTECVQTGYTYEKILIFSYFNLEMDHPSAASLDN